MKIVETFEDARALASGCVGYVPTMGYLHEGHLSLVEAARRSCDTVTVSIFVNPLQFAPSEDLSTYPRDLARDVALVEAAGADIVFAPALEEMYPVEPLTRVIVGTVTDTMEGAVRPGHFDGVATVVAKLFAGIQPDRAVFGRKDAQQLVTVRRMVADLSFPVGITGSPIVREQDGIALSSRNTYLDAGQRVAALSLSAGMAAVVEAVTGGERSGAALEAIAAAPVNAAGGIDLDYATLADQETALPISELDRPAFLAVAGRVGGTRLIDNVHIDRVHDVWVPDPGIRLESPSILYGGV
jgi:pantoate--beta-alanine ligase